MLTITKTNSTNQDFVSLVQKLDADLAIRDGEDHSFYNQFNKIDKIEHVLILYENEQAVACGALKEFNPGTMEVKRMYTLPEKRGNGFASKILLALEHWASELSYEKCILETGKQQPEAIGCYRKNGYKQIPNYGPYVNVENSLCFEKKLKKTP